MSNIPNASGYGPRGNAPFVIINGMRVPVGNGMRGSDLVSTAGPGRRAIKLCGGKAQFLEANKFYGADELMDKCGRPVKISSIPDRTKGAGVDYLQTASAERILVFLDYANIQAAKPPYSYIDYGRLLEYLGSWRFLVEAYAYVPIDPRMPDARRQLVRNLQCGGWMVYQKMGKIAGDSYKSNVDVEMSIDILRSAQQVRPDIVTICSGDGDFLPLVRELRRMGIRAEVASFEASADRSLQYEASGFISLDVWYEEMAYDFADQAEQGNQKDQAGQAEKIEQMEQTPLAIQAENGETLGTTEPQAYILQVPQDRSEPMASNYRRHLASQPSATGIQASCL